MKMHRMTNRDLYRQHRDRDHLHAQLLIYRLIGSSLVALYQMVTIYVQLIFRMHCIFRRLQSSAHDIRHQLHNVMRGNIRSLPLLEGALVLQRQWRELKGF